MSSRPNVLFLMSDEHPYFMTGCYGHGSVKTPALDGLANNGVIFDAAYCASPISAPSRAALMTSRLISTIEAWDNAAPLRSDWPTFAHGFRAAGYYTALCGKMHFIGPDQHHGFEERWTQDIYPATFDWTPHTRQGVVEAAGGQHVKRVHEAGCGRTADMDYDDEVLYHAQAGLRAMARNRQAQPWMLCVSFTGPHYPFKCPEPYWSMYSDEDAGLPRMPADFSERDSEYVRWLRTYGGFGKPVPDRACLNARRAVLGRTTMVDEFFAKILALLKETGLDDNTLIVYTSDHGDMLGERGLWYKNTAFEASSRVPLIVSGLGLKHRRIAEPVSHLDLGPTLCALAGIDSLYQSSDARSVADLVRGERPSGPGRALMEYYAEGVQCGWRAIRKGNLKYVAVHGYPAELYDLATDPGEWHNLINDPKYREQAEALARELAAGRDWGAVDEQRHQSEERRLAILKAIGSGRPREWQLPSNSPPHPLGFR